MTIGKKNISLILLISASLIAVWVLFKTLSSIYFAINSKSLDLAETIIKQDNHNQWLNLADDLKVSDLKNRVILLDFWTYDCVNCLQVNSKIKELEQEFGSKLTVIGVHCSNFESAKNTAAVRKAVIKYDIDYPVINDQNLAICNSFKPESIENIELPTAILLDYHGQVSRKYIGRNDINKHLKEDVSKLIAKYNYRLNRDLLPILLEKNKITGHVLSFPTRLEYVKDFEYNGARFPAMFIANSGKNNIIISSMAGEIIATIGSLRQGFDDGDFDTASFDLPNGMVYKNHKLYVADTNNDAIRVVDFKENKVSTLIAGEISNQNDSSAITLSSPTDIKFYPDADNIIIASAGNNQILQYDLTKQTSKIIAGDGQNGIKDGKYPQNSLAQTSSLAVFGQKIYFVDAKSSSLRVIDKDGTLTTLAAKGVAESEKSLLEHPLSLTVDDTGIYIADSYNNSIKKYDFSSHKINNFIGTKNSGNNLGSKGNTEFDEPNGIVSVIDKFYIADSNNDRIVVINRGNLKSSILNVMPPLRLPKDGLLEYLPNLQKLKNIEVNAKELVTIKINLPSGYKINELGPSFINLLKLTKNNQADLIANFDWRVIKNREIKLPKLNIGKNYILQGTIYYCSNQANSLCFINSYEQKISASDLKQDNLININLSNE